MSTTRSIRSREVWLLPALACVALAGACGGSADYTIGDDPVVPVADDADVALDAGFAPDAVSVDARDAQDAGARATTDAGRGAVDGRAPPPPPPPAPPPATGCPAQVPSGATMCCGAIACLGAHCALRCSECAATCGTVCCAPSDKEDPVSCVTSTGACQAND